MSILVSKCTVVPTKCNDSDRLNDSRYYTVGRDLFLIETLFLFRQYPIIFLPIEKKKKLFKILVENCRRIIQKGVADTFKGNIT